MRAVGYKRSLPIEHAEALIDVEIEKPAPQGRDLLVEVKAVSVNPVDTKVRKRAAPPDGAPKILGYDAAGVVVGVGSDARLFKPGDEVFYAGSILRPGTDAEYHLVDERIVGRKPKSLDFAAAAALPLTAITAWEMLFDRFGIARDGADGKSLLVIGGAGGVGSIAIQLARKLTKLAVITTASRPETTAWCKELGAHHVIDHSKPLPDQLKAIGHRLVDYIFGVNATEQYYDTIVEIIAPQGRFGLIDDPKQLDANKLRPKCASLHWESMFARSSFQTPDMQAQHDLLTEVARLVDAGVIRTTVTDNLGTINAANLKRAHALIEGGRTRGKLVLAGF
jgi:zinc-binding alcohol dehydrogenase family protein